MLAKLQSCEMRRDILLHESEEFELSLATLLKKKQAVSEGTFSIFCTIVNNVTCHTATSLPQTERRAVEAKMILLQEELNLIDEHDKAQQKKLTEITTNESAVQEKLASIHKTISNLEVRNIH